jgi:hypothetical protein
MTETMSPFSPNHDVKPDIYDLPSASSGTQAGPSSGLVWTANGPMLKMEDAVVETV